MRIHEIERTPGDPPGPPSTRARRYSTVPGLQPVPQNPQYAYTSTTLRGAERINLTSSDIAYEFYHLADGGASRIGVLKFRRTRVGGLRNSLQVSNVWLDDEFQNWGVGSMMYGVVLGSGHTIVADATQTPQARRLWVRLWSKPGVTVRGMIDVLRDDDDPDTARVRATLKRLRAVEMPGSGDPAFQRYSFPVRPRSDGRELTAPGIKLYRSASVNDNDYNDATGLYATVESAL